MRIGILGAGQLGQMLALAGYPLGNRFSFLDSTGNPSADIGNTFQETSREGVLSFLKDVERVTYEFEHLPIKLVEAISKQVSVFPSIRALSVCQNRVAEKQLFDELQIPVASYRIVDSQQALAQAVDELMQAGAPAVVAKSVTQGYDGKGQAVIDSVNQAPQAWQTINHHQLIVEAFVRFKREVSIIAARDQQGNIVCYPLAENHHHQGILRFSKVLLGSKDSLLFKQAETYIGRLLDALDYVGILTLELFEGEDGNLYANEMAPRVHNSGHWTQDGAVTSQFENHLRAIQGLPLGDTSALHPTCMINIIGELGPKAALLEKSNVHVHLYGKSERAGRKLGHVNLVAKTNEALMEKVTEIYPLLPGCPSPKWFEE